MRRPLRFPGLSLVSVVLFAVSTLACASGENSEVGAVGTTDAGDAIRLEFSQTYLTMENASGVPLVSGRVELVPRGVMAPFRMNLPRLEAGQKRDLLFNQFYSNDGTPFRRGVASVRFVRITATDVSGKTLTQEIPFD